MQIGKHFTQYEPIKDRSSQLTDHCGCIAAVSSVLMRVPKSLAVKQALTAGPFQCLTWQDDHLLGRPIVLCHMRTAIVQTAGLAMLLMAAATRTVSAKQGPSPQGKLGNTATPTPTATLGTPTATSTSKSASPTSTPTGLATATMTATAGINTTPTATP